MELIRIPQVKIILMGKIKTLSVISYNNKKAIGKDGKKIQFP